MDNALLYVASVYEAFHDEPESFDEFLKLALGLDATANRIDAIAMMTELMSGQWFLLQGLSVFIPNAKITIPPEAVELGMSKAFTFLNNVKTRFKSVDSHVYSSVVRTLILHKNGKKSFKKMRNKIVNLLYYHEDLTEEFSRIIPPKP